MIVLQKLKELLRDTSGNIAVFVTIMMPAIIGLTGAAVDMGAIYSSHAELQRAADAGALAGASTLLADEDGDSRFVGNYGGSRETAIDLVESNDLFNNPLTWKADNDYYQAGVWDFETSDFSRSGASDEPNDLDTVQVTLRREVETFFARILGLDRVNLSATSYAHLGCAGDGGQATVPICLNVEYLNEAPQELLLNSENDENMQWTTFRTSPTNVPTINGFIDDPSTIPPMDIGEELFLTNGTSTSVLKNLGKNYDLYEVNGEWSVILPVAQWATPPNRGTLVGFAEFVITRVNSSGDNKGVFGYWADNNDQVLQGAQTGGKCFGIRAASSKLIK